MKLLSNEEIVKLTTPRLLAYLRSLLKAHELPNWDETNAKSLSKASPEWQGTYNSVKRELSQREHVKK